MICPTCQGRTTTATGPFGHPERCWKCNGTGLAPQPTVFIDGNPPGCKCGPECEMPCWQRVGLTDQRCCAGCPPLPPREEAA